MDARDRDPFDDLPILADLRGLLAEHMREASTAAPARPARRRGWAIAGLRGVPLALAVAVAVAVVAIGLLALHHRTPAGHHPSAPAGHTVNPTGPQPDQIPPAVSEAVNRAQRETIARDHACSSSTNRGQTIDHGAPPKAMLSALGVLRRSPLPPDPTNRVLFAIGWDKGAGVYVNYIRRARTAYGRSYWIVPEARTTPFGAIPERCYREFHATLGRDLRHAPLRLRRQAFRAQAQELDVQREQTRHRGGLCFIEIGLHVRPHPGAVGFGCSPGISGTVPPEGGNGSGARGGASILSGIAADGIVAVTVRYAASGGKPARTITSNVVNNVYVLRIPPGTPHQPFPTRWLVRMADGRVLSSPRLTQGVRVAPASASHGGG